MKKKYEILYDWPVSEINRLANSEIASDFSDQLEESEQISFATITETLRGFGKELGKKKAAREHFTSWGSLRGLLEEFATQFGNFPDISPSKFKIFTCLAEKVDDASAPLDESEIDASIFEIRILQNELPITWFSKENSSAFPESIAILKTENLEQELASAIVSPNFVFHFLATLENTTLQNSQLGLVKRTTPQISEKSLEAYLRMHVVASGKFVHAPKSYTVSPRILNPNSIITGPDFQQWDDVIDVLSEYNSRDEILMKYLTIYHVIENLMFKRPIVELEQKNNGDMFSIRDFRRLYDGVNLNESKALSRLFQIIFATTIQPGPKTFSAHIIGGWSTLRAALAPADLDSALSSVGLSFTSSERLLTYGKFSDMVYLIRNSIVHNKATEFHLTYNSLTPAIEKIITTFLIPSLEEMIFEIIGRPMPQLWYQNSSMKLYQ